MQEVSSHTGDRPVSQWSESELERLREIAADRVTKTQIRKMFPMRSVGAVKVKLADERKRLGIARERGSALMRDDSEFTMLAPDEPGILCDYPLRRAAAAAGSNQAYLAALGIAA
jgi:hypothetical protein